MNVTFAEKMSRKDFVSCHKEATGIEKLKEKKKFKSQGQQSKITMSVNIH